MLPRFYSRLSIGLCSLFLTTFFGAILLSYNLREAGKGKMSWPLILCSLFWFPLIRELFERNGRNAGLLPLLVANALGAIILSYPVWDNLLEDVREYQVRPVWKPVGICIGICVALVLLQMAASGRLFGQ